jgi:uncharacterized spore protein YtfJ
MNSSDTAVLDTIRGAIGDAGGNRAFGEPVSRDGVTVLPAAKVSGGGGGGGGEGSPSARGEGKGTEGTGRGMGGGFRVSTKPVGAFVIKDGSVRWRPAIDVNKVILGGQIVAVTALLTIRAIVRARNRRAALASWPARRAIRMLNRRYMLH